MIEILTMSPNEVRFKIYDIPKSLTNLITIYLFCFIDFLTVYLILDANFNIIMTKISTMVSLIKCCLGLKIYSMLM